MTRYFPPRHGRTHYPGGSDPLDLMVDVTGELYNPPIVFQVIGVWDPPPTSPAGPLDWSDATVGTGNLQTNDPAGGATLTHVTDPFTTGSWYESDWTTHPTRACTILKSGVYVWQAKYFGSEVTAPPAPVPYTVIVGTNLLADQNVIYHGDPGFEGPATGLLGNYNWDAGMSGVLVVEPAMLDVPVTFSLATDFPDWDALEVQVSIAKVSDYEVKALTLESTVTGPPVS